MMTRHGVVENLVVGLIVCNRAQAWQHLPAGVRKHIRNNTGNRDSKWYMTQKTYLSTNQIVRTPLSKMRPVSTVQDLSFHIELSPLCGFLGYAGPFDHSVTNPRQCRYRTPQQKHAKMIMLAISCKRKVICSAAAFLYLPPSQT